MLDQWIVMEHHRLHVVEGWPETDYKRAVLEAIHSTLDSLSSHNCHSLCTRCSVCRSRLAASQTARRVCALGALVPARTGGRTPRRSYAARHRFRESVAVRVHTMGVSSTVTPVAPSGLQKAPGVTTRM